MIFKRKKKDIERLKSSFGELKDDNFNFENIKRYFLNKDNSECFHVLSDKTCNDLDFEELFMFIDRTCSKVGQQYLYNILRTVPTDSKHIELNEKIINELTNKLDFRIKTQRLLEKLKNNDAYYISSLFQEEHLNPPPKWFFVFRLLSFTGLLSLILLMVNPKLIIVFIGVFIINLVIHYRNKKNLYQYLDSIPQLIKLNRIASQLHKEETFKELKPDLANSIKIIDQVRNKMSFFQLDAKMQGDLEVLFWAILELFKIAFLLEPLLLFAVLKQLNTKRTEIEEVFCFVGKVDSLISIANLRTGLKSYCLPIIDNKEISVSVSNIYHPLINDCVTNSIDVKSKSVLLTGSNMSGKTTFIRTIGINIITGLALNTCFAESVRIPRIRIFSAIRISDDLINDKSYYFEEVLTIKEMIDNSENIKPNLFLLDEIFKGTNTIERISAGKAVLSSLTKNNNIVFVSTHDIELTDMLTDDYELYHFSEFVDDKNIDFDYKIKKGKLKNRNAIRILQINDYPDNIIKEAIEISKKLDKISAANNIYK
jgi:DNA mismatch repair ATPase MutS